MIKTIPLTILIVIAFILLGVVFYHLLLDVNLLLTWDDASDCSKIIKIRDSINNSRAYVITEALWFQEGQSTQLYTILGGLITSMIPYGFRPGLYFFLTTLFTGSLIMIYLLLGWMKFNRLERLIVVILFISSPEIAYLFMNVHRDALMSVFVVLSVIWGATCSLTLAKERRSLIVMGILMSCGIMTNISAVIFLIPIFVIILVRIIKEHQKRIDKTIIALIWLLIPIAIYTGPWWVHNGDHVMNHLNATDISELGQWDIQSLGVKLILIRKALGNYIPACFLFGSIAMILNFLAGILSIRENSKLFSLINSLFLTALFGYLGFFIFKIESTLPVLPATAAFCIGSGVLLAGNIKAPRTRKINSRKELALSAFVLSLIMVIAGFYWIPVKIYRPLKKLTTSANQRRELEAFIFETVKNIKDQCAIRNISEANVALGAEYHFINRNNLYLYGLLNNLELKVTQIGYLPSDHSFLQVYDMLHESNIHFLLLPTFYCANADDSTLTYCNRYYESFQKLTTLCDNGSTDWGLSESRDIYHPHIKDTMLKLYWVEDMDLLFRAFELIHNESVSQNHNETAILSTSMNER